VKIISIRRPPPVDVPALITRLRTLGQTYESIRLALGVSANQVKNWAQRKSAPSFEDTRALLILAEKLEEEGGNTARQA
jgi:DNA-binding transcriptional regulator YiaG